MFNLLGSLLFGNRSVVVDGQSEVANDVNTQAERSPDTHTSEEWDIVDRLEEADKCSTDGQVVYGPEPAPDMFQRAEDDNEVILGSFFERNEHSNDDQERYKIHGYEEEELPEAKSKDWLITPLPCLTSITASQRSTSENSELENLLIEHPSMSVFVTATSTSIIESFEQPSPAHFRSEKKEKASCEKRKSADSATSESPSGTLKRKGKKSKKSNALQCNKENVRALMFTETKKASAQAKKFDTASMNSKQMGRFNKSSAFKSTNVNMNKRKYHKLQQPSVL